ncbi:MAG: recC, partial [Gammaproteobacteria bacterium]|nr:recC [Gammaproteobacteria bacterium]
MIQNLDSHTLVLTANSRLSTYLKKKYDMVQSHTGKKTWQTLNCLPFDQWIYKVVENATTTHTILNDAQELALWENIISQANCHNAIYHPFKIAEIAQQAWHLIKQWRVSLDEISTSFSSDDARLFHQWATTFATICKKQRWLIQDDCTDLLIQALQTSTMDLPKNIVIAGFDEFTSQKKYLISLLEKYTHVNFYKTQKKTNTIPSRIKATDENQEILYMARWAKKTLFQYPNASIACVAPHLNQIHGKIISVFTEVFSDNPTDILNERTLPFNISSSHTFYEN